VSVDPFVRHAGIVSKRLDVESRKYRRTIAQELSFSDSKNLGEIPIRSPQRVRQIEAR